MSKDERILFILICFMFFGAFAGIVYVLFIEGFNNNNYYYDNPYIDSYEDDYLLKEKERQKKIESRNYIDETFNPYFSLLNNEEKQVYYDIFESAKNIDKENIELVFPIPFDRFQEVFFSVLNDNPELFWLKSYYFGLIDEKVNIIRLMYIDEIDNIVSMRQNFDNIVNSIVNEANKYTYDYEKERYVHDTLINKITFDETTRSEQNAYFGLVNNRAVCAGYSKAFQLIMRKLNIPTYYLVGDSIKYDNTDDEDTAHAWNLIKLGNKYYNVDVTWDDHINEIVYDYYNVNDEIFNKDHIRSELSMKLPRAT